MPSGNPRVNQGFLNRVKGAFTVTGDASLNVTASYQTREGVSMRPVTAATDVIPTMTGTVGSQSPYQQVEVTVNIVRSTSLANTWKRRFGTDTALGECVFTSDSTVLEDFTIENAYLTNFDSLTVNGTEVGYVLTISGYLITNDNMWS